MKKILFILFLAIAVNTLAQQGQSQSKYVDDVVEISVNQAWPASIPVRTGEILIIKVKGVANFSYPSKTSWNNADGIKNSSSSYKYENNDLPLFSVIGRINNGRSFFIGTDLVLKIEQYGLLQFTMNESLNGYNNNKGLFVAYIIRK